MPEESIHHLVRRKQRRLLIRNNSPLDTRSKQDTLCCSCKVTTYNITGLIVESYSARHASLAVTCEPQG